MLSALAFSGLIFGLSSTGESVEGNAPVPPVIPIVVGTVALLLFVRRQLVLQRLDDALLDMRPLLVPVFAFGVTMLMISMAALLGMRTLLPIYLQQVMGFGTLATGLSLLPGGLAMGMIAPFVGRAFDRWGPRPLIVPGSFIVALALGAMCLLTPTSPLVQVIATHVTLSIGLGLVNAATAHLDPRGAADRAVLARQRHHQPLQQVAGAAGKALFIPVMTTTANANAHAGESTVAAQAARCPQRVPLRWCPRDRRRGPLVHNPASGGRRGSAGCRDALTVASRQRVGRPPH